MQFILIQLVWKLTSITLLYPSSIDKIKLELDFIGNMSRLTLILFT